ncbi:MAG: DUF4249 family protein [Ignavibacteriales bacterium]|nr:DUF4249 family protein [Ignavibacteriales bacterium]
MKVEDIKRERGQGTREMGQGSRDRGQGTRERGQGTREMGQGSRDRGQVTREMGQGTREMGLRNAEMEDHSLLSPYKKIKSLSKKYLFHKQSIIKHQPFYILILVLSLCSLFLSSCEENVNPKAPFRDRYILNFIVRGDTSYQIAVLTHSYTVNGVDPYENEIDPAIKDADIKIWYDSDVYTMRDTTIARNDTSRYKSPVYYYYLKNFKPGDDKYVEVKAELTNGRSLSSLTKIPAKISIDSVDRMIPSADKPNYTFAWKSTGTGIYYLSRFRFTYTIREGSTITWYNKEVPITYNRIGDQDLPVFPSITKNSAITFENSALDSAMKEISKGETDKSKFELKKAEYELLVFDKPLSNYYSSIHGYLDDFSVRIDESDYSNVTGGFGIFASYLKQIINVTFKEKYVKSFGYRYGFD